MSISASLADLLEIPLNTATMPTSPPIRHLALFAYSEYTTEDRKMSSKTAGKATRPTLDRQGSCSYPRNMRDAILPWNAISAKI